MVKIKILAYLSFSVHFSSSSSFSSVPSPPPPPYPYLRHFPTWRSVRKALRWHQLLFFFSAYALKSAIIFASRRTKSWHVACSSHLVEVQRQLVLERNGWESLRQTLILLRALAAARRGRRRKHFYARNQFSRRRTLSGGRRRRREVVSVHHWFSQIFG